MFNKILLPVDLSDKHQRALDVAADLANQSGGAVTFFHVIEVMAGLSLEEEREFYQRLEQKARKHIEQLRGRLKSAPARAQAEIVFGHRVTEIVRHARESGTDLIVLTAPQIDPSNPGIGWASLSYKVSLLAACPVLLVK